MKLSFFTLFQQAELLCGGRLMQVEGIVEAEVCTTSSFLKTRQMFSLYNRYPYGTICFENE
jgi:hypothetical protein